MVIHFIQPNRAGALHNYSRPCIPQCAMVLRKAYHQLRENYGKTALAKMPVAGMLSDPTRTIDQETLVKHARKMLRQAGAEEMQMRQVQAQHKRDPRVAISTRLLHNTYEYNLYHRCGLEMRSGTAQFLLGYSVVNDVTSNNYTSFTSPEAQERLYTILRVLRPEKSIDPPTSPVSLDNGKEQYTAAPPSTARVAGAVFTVLLLPDQHFRIACPHGDHSSVAARELRPDGTVRRKSPVRKKEETQID